jgi:hypothetical protein
VGNLKHRQAGRHVSSRMKVASFFVLKGRVAYLQKQPDIVSSEVAHSESVASIGIILYDRGMVGPGVAHFELRSQRIGVDEPDLPLLKDSIVKFEYLPAYKLIVSVYYHHYFTRTAYIFRSRSDIRQRIKSCLIYDDFKRYFSRIFIFQVVFYLLSCFIVGGIVDYYNLKIGIILHEDRPDIKDITFLGFIIESGDDDANGQLLVLANIILFLVVVSLSFRKLLSNCGLVIEHVLEGLGLCNLLLGYIVVTVVVERVRKDILHGTNILTWGLFR